MVVKLPSGADLDGMRAVAGVVARTIDSMRRKLRAGITTRELDAVGRRELANHGARSAPELVYGFPAATCISVNDQAAHGIPGDREVRDADLVNIDVSAELDGYYADAGASFPVGAVTPLAQQLCDAAQEALCEALRAVRPGKLVNAVGRAVERVAGERGFRVIRKGIISQSAEPLTAGLGDVADAHGLGDVADAHGLGERGNRFVGCRVHANIGT